MTKPAQAVVRDRNYLRSLHIRVLIELAQTEGDEIAVVLAERLLDADTNLNEI